MLKQIPLFIFVLILLTEPLSAQEFFEDGSMKLTEISSDKDYGYQEQKPIKVGDDNAYKFLVSLLGPNGEKTHSNRLGSCCNYEYKPAPFGTALLNKWEITYDGLSKPIVLYLNGYEYEDPKCPYGFTFKKTVDNSTVFPVDSIVKVTVCNEEKIYAAENYLFKENVGEFPAPNKTPQFKGGIEELKKYFIANPLHDEEAEKMVFRVTIAFLVDCNGNAGNYQIASKGTGDLRKFANEVLAVVNKMPQNWEPAFEKGKEVDCYQILTFTVAAGKLDKVSYK